MSHVKCMCGPLRRSRYHSHLLQHDSHEHVLQVDAFRASISLHVNIEHLQLDYPNKVLPYVQIQLKCFLNYGSRETHFLLDYIYF